VRQTRRIFRCCNSQQHLLDPGGSPGSSAAPCRTGTSAPAGTSRDPPCAACPAPPGPPARPARRTPPRTPREATRPPGRHRRAPSWQTADQRSPQSSAPFPSTCVGPIPANPGKSPPPVPTDQMRNQPATDRSDEKPRVPAPRRAASQHQLSGRGSPITSSRPRGLAKSRKRTIWPSRMRRIWMDVAANDWPVVVTVPFVRISTITTSGSQVW